MNKLSLEALQATMADFGQPAFRGKQIIEWIYGKGAVTYDDMTNLPKTLREQLKQELPFDVPVIVDKRVSRDGSRKYVLELADGQRVETVGIPSRDTNEAGDPRRLTVCFSTQVGCAMACLFCATGREGFTRNLYPGEIVQQVLTVQRDFGLRVSNVVGMGQGEPFLNYDNLIDALHILNAPKGLAIGARHITVSTCGIPDGIAAFAREKEQFTLAVSLHSAVQRTREIIMPRASLRTCAELKSDLEAYTQVCGRRVSLEYLMIANMNDDEEHLEALIAFCRGLNAHINLLPLNNVVGSPLHPCDKTTVRMWMDRLAQAGIETSFRDSRGADIDGACGQLKNAIAGT